jgi:hypothetical protein
MHSWRRALGYGVLVWAVPFVVAMIFYWVRLHERILFESIMPVAVVATAVVATVLYMSGVPSRQAREGLRLGVLWLAMCIAIDQVFFMAGPMRMTLLDYLKDIGLTYAMIPCITTGHGIMQQRAMGN